MESRGPRIIAWTRIEEAARDPILLKNVSTSRNDKSHRFATKLKLLGRLRPVFGNLEEMYEKVLFLADTVLSVAFRTGQMRWIELPLRVGT